MRITYFRLGLRKWCQFTVLLVFPLIPCRSWRKRMKRYGKPFRSYASIFKIPIERMVRTIKKRSGQIVKLGVNNWEETLQIKVVFKYHGRSVRGYLSPFEFLCGKRQGFLWTKIAIGRRTVQWNPDTLSFLQPVFSDSVTLKHVRVSQLEKHEFKRHFILRNWLLLCTKRTLSLPFGMQFIRNITDLYQEEKKTFFVQVSISFRHALPYSRSGSPGSTLMSL